jgi:alcohol dehydrogenase (cytochrome c)
VYALRAGGGEVAWRYHSQSPILSGVTPTAGGVVFSGEADGNLLVLNARTGRLLKKQALGGSMGGGVITYAVAGKQYVATTSGNVSRAGFSAAGQNVPRLIVMTTGLGPSHHPVKVDAFSETEGKYSFGANQGKALFNTFCAGCHGVRGSGGEGGPSLQGEVSRRNLAQIIAWIKNPSPPMPNLYLHPLMESEVEDIARYVAEFK